MCRGFCKNRVFNGDAQGYNCVESCLDDLVHFKIKVSHFNTFFFNLCFHFISVQWIDVDALQPAKYICFGAADKMYAYCHICACKCVLAAIHEFPEDIFTKEQRKNGAVILHALCVSWTHNIRATMKTTSFILLNLGC